MKTKHAVRVAFFLNLSFSVLEFIFGSIFNSSSVLADAVHDLGDALAIGLSACLETVSNRQEDKRYTLGYKRFSLLGAILTSVILLTGSFMMIIENIPRLIKPEVVDYQGMLVLGIIAIIINLLASLIVRKGKTKNESILSLHFLEDILGWLAVIVVSGVLYLTDWYILDPLLSLLISSFILWKAIPRFWSSLKIFLDAVPEGLDSKKLEQDLLSVENVKSINQLNIWSMDGLENNAIVHLCIEDWMRMEDSKEDVRYFLRQNGVHNITIEVDTSPMNHNQHKRCLEDIGGIKGHEH